MARALYTLLLVAALTRCELLPTTSAPDKPVCGNGVLEDGWEECDCGEQGQDLPPGCPFHNGEPLATCDLRCGHFTPCGDGVIGPEERCDATNLGQETCASLGYAGGSLACAPTCRWFDTTGCYSICGNGVQEAEEACDGSEYANPEWGGCGCTAECEVVPCCGERPLDACSFDAPEPCCVDEWGKRPECVENSQGSETLGICTRACASTQDCWWDTACREGHCGRDDCLLVNAECEIPGGNDGNQERDHCVATHCEHGADHVRLAGLPGHKRLHWYGAEHRPRARPGPGRPRQR